MLPSPRVGGALSGALMWSIADAGAGVKREGVPGSRRGRSRENSSYDQLYSNAAPVRASPEGHSNFIARAITPARIKRTPSRIPKPMGLARFGVIPTPDSRFGTKTRLSPGAK